ncbi:hypothetical protein [Marinobacter similis]|uniref:hypothetical protein n=1 Tax=Marinobacter similis TaxID=1420916 RepID=UPI001F3221C7|nr:hypothetical protein [Marinobacter similis]
MSQNEARYTVRSLILTAVVAVIATVLVLESSGRIDHSDNKDHVPVGDFQAINIKPEEPFRMSPKARNCTPCVKTVSWPSPPMSIRRSGAYLLTTRTAAYGAAGQRPPPRQCQTPKRLLLLKTTPVPSRAR